MASENIIYVADDEFEEKVLKSETPVLVDFWAEWCGPCRKIGPLVEELAEAYAGRAVVAKIDIDRHQQAANKLGVQSIPTLIIFKNGEVAERVVGLVPKERIAAALDQAMG